MDKDELEDGEPEKYLPWEKVTEFPDSSPETKKGYEIAWNKHVRILLGALFLLFGFLLQILSYFV